MHECIVFRSACKESSRLLSHLLMSSFFASTFTIICKYEGIARTQSPTTTNYALDLPTFGVIAGVNPTAVQWKGLALGDRPC